MNLRRSFATALAFGTSLSVGWAVQDKPVVEWIRRSAIALATPEAGHGFDDMQPLKKVIGDARIVSLGEATHGSREIFQLKHRMLEFLATEMGFTIFSIEANMPEAYRLNDYVLNGTGDPAQLLRGMYFWTWDTEEVLEMIQWMREFNKSGTRARRVHRLRHADADGGGGHRRRLRGSPRAGLRRRRCARRPRWPDGRDLVGCREAVSVSPPGRFPLRARRARRFATAATSRRKASRGARPACGGAWMEPPVSWRSTTCRLAARRARQIGSATRLSFPSTRVSRTSTSACCCPAMAWRGSTVSPSNWMDSPTRTPACSISTSNPPPREGFFTGGNGYRVQLDPTSPTAASRVSACAASRRLPNAPAPPTPKSVASRWKGIVAHLEAGRTTYRASGAADREIDWAIQNARVVLQSCRCGGTK